MSIQEGEIFGIIGPNGAGKTTTVECTPSGAAARALLYSVFNQTPPVTTLGVLVGYALVFVLVAVRYFRWE
ncbi:MAG: ATP-binding cassette domain-containing protein [Candidatus Dormibacteria bacterium]